MLDSKVKLFLNRRGFDLQHKRIAVAVSGGPDSLALLHYLKEKSAIFHIELLALHVDHMFRGEESLQDAQFVEQFCEKLDIPFKMERIDVPAYMKVTGKSGQVAARECRYRFFAEMMKNENFTYLALGHHGDDQAETVLMRLARGSTGAARAGIPFERKFAGGFIIRPFLCLSREEIEDYCREHQLNPRRDPSNEKDTYSRNRFRHHVLPFLRHENPQMHEQFQRFSEDLESDEDLLQELTFREMNKVMEKKKDNEVRLAIDLFLDMPMPLQRRGIQLILNYLYNEKPSSLSAVHIENVFSLIRNPHPSGVLHLPGGLIVKRSYRECSFSFQTKDLPQSSYHYELFEPGKIDLPNGSSIEFEFTCSQHAKDHSGSLLLSADSIPMPLIIRTRKNGDRIDLRGMKGTKKIKDIFIDQKVPRDERDQWPVLTDATGKILWLPGLRKSDEPMLGDAHSCYILLKYIKQ
ncbi:tRNA lysidine(34) synthetase TilS [Cytobacillus gottheilii]|uniref:tRNA lysidine(34) synthetase TilS n=1 Tax=Cytobacillus gottheilii TaxID=859144 RepID=UPI0024951160|nr:tRNA lysidine(34) synthetase TilS [Cytobacillus gottheilii]